MGKNRHSKDRLFLTATEWERDYGGKKHNTGGNGSLSRPLPFDHCALNLAPFLNPVILQSKSESESSDNQISNGVIFDFESIVPYLKQYKSDPVTGKAMTTKDIIRLNMFKNPQDQWHCPVTCKVFTDNSHVVAIRNTGNVYSYDAVNELNIKAKNFTDLLNGEIFKKSDIITLQNPQNKEQMSYRDLTNFIHLKKVREENVELRKTDSSLKLKHNLTSESVMKEIENNRLIEKETGVKRKTIESIMANSAKEYNTDVARILDLEPLTLDVNPGQVNTDGKASTAFTSSAVNTWTSNATRLATAEEIRQAKWKIMRQIGKKGYVQLQTTAGNLNLEIHCDITMRTAWNFITLCKEGYYDNMSFHRLIKGFMVQTGDPTGTGAGGQSAFKTPFTDEFDTRLVHNTKGIVSMANSGTNTNGSQFFMTFKETPHLDLKHAVFGRVVGGLATLDKIEEVGSDKKEKPLQEIKIIKAIVFTNPIEEAEEQLYNFINNNIKKRKESKSITVLPTASSSAIENTDVTLKSRKLM